MKAIFDMLWNANGDTLLIIMLACLIACLLIAAIPAIVMLVIGKWRK